MECRLRGDELPHLVSILRLLDHVMIDPSSGLLQSVLVLHVVVFLMAMTLVCCGSLASLHSHTHASPSRVSASCPASLHLLFFWAQVCKHCTNRSDLVGVDQSSWKQPHRTTTGIRSPARTCASLLRPGGPHARKYTTTDPGVCDSGPCICGEPSAFQSQWSKTASEGAAFVFSLVVGCVIGVCLCKTLCCTTPT